MDGRFVRMVRGSSTGILQRLIPGINVVLVLLLADSLAGLSWRLLPSSDTEIALAPPIAPMSASQSRGGHNLNGVASLHLFGESRSDEPAATAAPVAAPETRLSLSLRGVVAVASGALALIASGSAEEQLYKVGDALPGGAKLHEVQADRVILERGGRFETLTLPKESAAASVATAGGPPAATASRAIMPAASGGGDPSALRAVRDQVVQNPQEAFNLMRAQPVMEGDTLKGYRVMPGRERSLFNGTGLRPGDVVTRVNGLPLNDPAQMGQLFEQLKSANRFDVVVERGGRETQLTVDLGQ